MTISSPGHRYSEREIRSILHRPRRDANGPMQRIQRHFVQTLCRYHLDFAFGLISVPLLVHIAYPAARPVARQFFRLSYHDVSTHTYTTGKADLAYIAYYAIALFGLRGLVMRYGLRPLASQVKTMNPRTMERLTEQGWLAMWHSLSFASGMKLWTSSQYFLDLDEMWKAFPKTNTDASTKMYYLIQIAFWLQQVLVVNLERRRKDHWQMCIHHATTSILLFTSYIFYLTDVGNVILCIMDAADIILPFAKVLNYLAYPHACNAAFGLFVLIWSITRHVLFPWILWSVWHDLPRSMPFGCYSISTRTWLSQEPHHSERHLPPFFAPTDVICFDEKVHRCFLGLLMVVEGIITAWSWMIFQVARKVAHGHDTHDARSDGEDDSDDLRRGKKKLS